MFCKILKGEIPTSFVYQDDKVVAFKDINPKAPVHLLVIPRKHIVSVTEVRDEDESLLGHILLVAKKIAQDFQVAESGYRLIINNGPDAGQAVAHLHLHLQAGQSLDFRKDGE